jgi:hypothetical protein
VAASIAAGAFPSRLDLTGHGYEVSALEDVMLKK